MSTIEQSGTAGSLSWAGAVLRALHPVRWGLCLLGLAVSLALCSFALVLFGGVPQRLEAWWEQPDEQLRLLQELLLGGGTQGLFIRGALLTAALSVPWGLIAAWIARAELLCQRDAEPGTPVQATPNELVRARLSSLCMLLPIILIFAGVLLIPTQLAGVITRIIPWGIGAFLVSLLLPIVLLLCLVLAVVLTGAISYLVMPAALAAEGTDSFDALSRGYSYFYQAPLFFLGCVGLAAGVASLPVVAVLLLFQAQPGLLDVPGQSLATFVMAGLSLSCFWTLQGLVYLKLRRLIDAEPETAIWDGSLEQRRPRPVRTLSTAGVTVGQEGTGDQTESQQDKAAAGAPAAEAPVIETPAAPEDNETAPGPLPPVKESFTFLDTITGGPGLDISRSNLLFLGLLWAGLVVFTASWAAWQLTGAPGPDMAPERLREAVVKLAAESPGLFGLVAFLTVLAAALGLIRPLKRTGRVAALKSMYGASVPAAATRPFLERTRAAALGSVGVLSAGVVLYLLALAAALFALGQTSSWEVVGVLAGFAVALLGLGSFGLAATSVDGGQPEEKQPSVAGAFLGSAPEMLASGLVNVVLGSLRFALVLGVGWLTWFLTCETTGWIGGERATWVRWGLDGRLAPDAEAGLEPVASVIAGLFFLLLTGTVVLYPIINALHWGTLSYLRARQATADAAPPEALELTEEESRAVRQQRKGQKMKKQ
jgi:hypothetical protein